MNTLNTEIGRITKYHRRYHCDMISPSIVVRAKRARSALERRSQLSIFVQSARPLLRAQSNRPVRAFCVVVSRRVPLTSDLYITVSSHTLFPKQVELTNASGYLGISLHPPASVVTQLIVMVKSSRDGRENSRWISWTSEQIVHGLIIPIQRHKCIDFGIQSKGLRALLY
jgi:hypothetical protein